MEQEGVMQTTIPMPELKHKTEAVYYWLDRVQPGRIFTAREVMGAIHRMSNGQMHIMDGTVTRYFREYNKKNGRKLVVVVGKPQDSKYMKLDPTEWVQGTFDQMEAGKGARV
jgi:hypothetical protein